MVRRGDKRPRETPGNIAFLDEQQQEDDDDDEYELKSTELTGVGVGGEQGGEVERVWNGEEGGSPGRRDHAVILQDVENIGAIPLPLIMPPISHILLCPPAQHRRVC